ncbi:helicase associated domain-containing protein [Streptomyces sp. NPDC001546]|uniref:helicase associated domain-containing protein n=1 Tax=Streptomyces sp. NPDC001546 TaxID=3364585 RepID=UPI00368C8389
MARDLAVRYIAPEREGDLDVPYDHVEGAYPLGRWLSDQRRAYRAGTMTGQRALDLEQPGIVWDTADAGFAENLAAARAYFELHGTLAAPRYATALDKPVGQWLTDVRRPGGLGKDPDRAARRAAALAAIDEDWNPGDDDHGCEANRTPAQGWPGPAGARCSATCRETSGRSGTVRPTGRSRPVWS